MKKYLLGALLCAAFGLAGTPLHAQATPVSITTLQQFGDQDYDSYGIKIITNSTNSAPYNVKVRCASLETDTTYTLSGFGQSTAIMALPAPIQLTAEHVVQVTVKQGADSTTGQVMIYTLPPSGIDVLMTTADTFNVGNNVIIMGNVYNYDGFAGVATVRIYDSQNGVKYTEEIPYAELQTFVEPTLIATQANISGWAPGTYGITIQAGNQWMTSVESDKLYFTKASTVGISEAQKPELKVGPNPFQDQLYIDVPEPNTELVIRDMLGKTLATEYATNNGKLTLNTSTLPKGVYFLSLKKGDQVKTIRLTK